jgi:hypothetical protein
MKPPRNFIWIFAAMLLLAVCIESKCMDVTITNGPPVYSKISFIKEFAFGGIGFGGTTSNGEKIFQNIFSSSDPLSGFKKLYAEAEGNNEAQMYAMVAFYYLDKKEFERLKAECKGKKIQISCMMGCCGSQQSLDELIVQVENRNYDAYVPEKFRSRAKQ